MIIPSCLFYLPGDLEQKIANPPLADVYFARGQTILLERERIKHQTFKTRRLLDRGNAA